MDRADRVAGGGDPAGHPLAQFDHRRPVAQLGGDAHHRVGRRTGRQEAELVTAQPGRQGLGKHRPAQRQHGGETFQQAIADGVAEGVVHRFQAVQIADDEADDRAVEPVPLDGLVEPDVDRAPVGQPGQRIGEGQLADLFEPLGLGDPGGHDGGEHGREVRVPPPEDGPPDGPRHVQLAPRPAVQHDRRDHAAAPAPPPERGDPLVAVRPGAPRGTARPGLPVGGLHPGVGLAAARPALVQELGDLRELVDRVRLLLGELLLPVGPLAGVHEHPQPAPVPLPHRERGETAVQRLARAQRRRPPRFTRRVGRRHGLRQRHHGPQPFVVTTHSSSLCKSVPF